MARNAAADILSAQVTTAREVAKSYTVDEDGMIRDADRKAVGQVKGREDLGFTVINLKGNQISVKSVLAATRWVALHQSF